MCNPIDKFLGKKFYASIGEPWDFISQAGQNRLEGVINEIIYGTKNQPIIICNIKPFLSDGNEIQSIAGVNRYISSQNIIDNLSLSKPITLNFFYQKSGQLFQSENIETILNAKNICSFLVGSLIIEES